MGKIVILDEITSNKIAAGEVIEKPASVVKELIENSIDAGAGHISVEIRNGGISLIKVTDNGSGIDEDDAEIAFERHSTSKIRNADELDSIKTMGFRGEALASIASVSTVELTSRIQKNLHGTFAKIQGGNLKDIRQTGCPVGTTIIVKELFYNTPARFKFLKKDSTEAGYVSEVISRLALGNPQISFRLSNNNVNVLHTPGNNDLLSAIFSIYGKDVSNEVIKIDYESNKMKITGYAGKPEISRSNRNQQSIFLNGRYIRNKVISSAIDEAYNTYLMKNKFAFIVLNIELNPKLVDVNVHPTKMEVRFSEEQEIFRNVYHSIINALSSKSLIKDIKIDEIKKGTFKFEHSNFNDKQNNVQQNFSTIKNDNKINDNTVNDLIVKETIYTKINSDTDIPLNLYTSQKSEIPLKIEPILLKEESLKENQENYSTGKTKNVLLNSRIIGQAFSTFIILQSDEGLLLIDQHAAHERILYEKLKSKYENNESLSQMLITPLSIELTNHEMRHVSEEKDFLSKIGYIYEEFGNNSIILRAIPFFDNKIYSPKEVFLEVIDFLIKKGKSDYSLLADETLHTIACKAAIKANKRLDEMEIKNILKEMGDIDNPFTCPHGRPTIIKLSKYELEKMFKRII